MERVFLQTCEAVTVAQRLLNRSKREAMPRRQKGCELSMHRSEKHMNHTTKPLQTSTEAIGILTAWTPSESKGKQAPLEWGWENRMRRRALQLRNPSADAVGAPGRPF